MKITKKKLTELKRPEKNLRMHTDNQLREFKRSVEMFGQIRPIVIDENNIMLAGNGLYETLLQMGRTEADCYVVTGLSEVQKKKLMLADNRIFDLGVDDLAAFDSFILELKDDLDIPGWDEDILQALVMDEKEVDNLMSDYGLVPQDKIDDIRETHERYQERDEQAAQKATQQPTVPRPEHQIPQEVRTAAEYSEPFKSEQPEQSFILCPKCGERIWI